MTAKEYLSQAFRIDQRINNKLEQLNSLRALAVKANATVTEPTLSGSHNVRKMEDIIAKIVDTECDINTDINALMDIKRDIMAAIKRVDNLECQILLELRYLCYKPWERIAVDMQYGIDNIYRLHRQALNYFKLPKGIQ